MKEKILAIIALSVFSSVALAAVPNGQKLFQDNCASCHGKNGEGKIGPRLVGDSSGWSHKEFERAVLEGIDDEGAKLKSPMPHWADSSLKSDHGKAPTKAEVDAIQAYLQTLK